MLVLLKLKEGTGQKFEAAFATAAAATRKEKGCITYELSRSAKAPNRYLAYERWKDLAALEAHLKAKHITTLLAEIGDLLDGPPEVQVFLPAGR